MSDIGRTQNTNDEANIPSSITLNATTSTKIADANTRRIFFHVNNNTASDAIWIKLQAASVDNDKKGIYLQKKDLPDGRWQMPPDNIYTGEISAIADSGTPDVFVTEY